MRQQYKDIRFNMIILHESYKLKIFGDLDYTSISVFALTWYWARILLYTFGTKFLRYDLELQH